MALQPLRRVPGPVDRVVAIRGPRFRDSISTRAGHRSTWPVAMGRAGRTSVARPSAAKTGAILRFTPSRQRGHCQIFLVLGRRTPGPIHPGYLGDLDRRSGGYGPSLWRLQAAALVFAVVEVRAVLRNAFSWTALGRWATEARVAGSWLCAPVAMGVYNLKLAPHPQCPDDADFVSTMLMIWKNINWSGVPV